MYRRTNSYDLEILLVHPGGPYFKNKDLGAWSIPKGEISSGKTDLLSEAIREFAEETGKTPAGTFSPLGSVVLAGGKTIHAWAIEGNLDNAIFKSNTFELEWPPNSGQIQNFPEVDKAEFFSLKKAKEKINPAQAEFIDRLTRLLQM